LRPVSISGILLTFGMGTVIQVSFHQLG
jgi:hypothetical protein